MTFLFWLNRPDATHDRVNERHSRHRLTARDQTALESCDGRVFAAAACTIVEVRLTLKGFLAIEQSFHEGDQVLPAFDAIHGGSVLVDDLFRAFAGRELLP